MKRKHDWFMVVYFSVIAVVGFMAFELTMVKLSEKLYPGWDGRFIGLLWYIFTLAVLLRVISWIVENY